MKVIQRHQGSRAIPPLQCIVRALARTASVLVDDKAVPQLYLVGTKKCELSLWGDSAGGTHCGEHTISCTRTVPHRSRGTIRLSREVGTYPHHPVGTGRYFRARALARWPCGPRTRFFETIRKPRRKIETHIIVRSLFAPTVRSPTTMSSFHRSAGEQRFNAPPPREAFGLGGRGGDKTDF